VVKALRYYSDGPGIDASAFSAAIRWTWDEYGLLNYSDFTKIYLSQSSFN
jgi:hypothetical protein